MAVGVVGVVAAVWFLRLFHDARQLRRAIRERMATMNPDERKRFMGEIDSLSMRTADRIVNRMWRP